jgi:hypothetical protein
MASRLVSRRGGWRLLAEHFGRFQDEKGDRRRRAEKK